MSPAVAAKWRLEWFFSTEELCKIIYDLRDSKEIGINPGLTNKKDWYRVGYKGGEEPGVLQYTHLLQNKKDSNIYTVSITVNNKDKNIDEQQINNIIIRLISLIKEEKV